MPVLDLYFNALGSTHLQEQRGVAVLFEVERFAPFVGVVGDASKRSEYFLYCRAFNYKPGVSWIMVHGQFERFVHSVGSKLTILSRA